MKDYDYECRECGEKYSEPHSCCPKCGSSKKIIYISVNDEMCMGAEVNGMRAKSTKLTGKKKILWEWERKKTVRGDNGAPVERYKMVDRQNDLYEEVVTDLTSAQVIHECKEPLSEHTGHGSAKEKGNKEEQGDE